MKQECVHEEVSALRRTIVRKLILLSLFHVCVVMVCSTSEKHVNCKCTTDKLKWNFYDIPQYSTIFDETRPMLFRNKIRFCSRRQNGYITTVEVKQSKYQKRKDSLLIENNIKRNNNTNSRAKLSSLVGPLYRIAFVERAIQQV